MLSRSLRARRVHSSRLLIAFGKVLHLLVEVFANFFVTQQVSGVGIFNAQTHLLVKPLSVSRFALNGFRLFRGNGHGWSP